MPKPTSRAGKREQVWQIATRRVNFCEVTGQPNWCDDYMQCDGKRGLCPVQHWCVCEWAFASYITRAGGCDKIQSIDCEATNRWAYLHYQQKGASEALACLESRCGL